MFDDNDPRLTDEYVRQLPGHEGSGAVVLTGVVHDHPASAYRVQTIVDAVEPAVLALELPPLAVPLYRRYADDTRTPPDAGGEMSAAIQAASTDTVVGIDGPSRPFLWRLARTLHREDIEPSSVRPLLRGLGSVSIHAVACWLAAGLGRRAPRWLPVDDPVRHDCDPHDTPGQQAADERAQIRRAETVSTVFGQPGAVAIRDDTREAHMADQLATLRQKGTVVAVVGMGHLDPVAERLE